MNLFKQWPSQIPTLNAAQCKQAIEKLKQGFDDILMAEQLQDIDPAQLENLYLPLSHLLNQLFVAKGKTLVVGINGGQGSGKTTLTKLLKFILTHHFGLNVASFSIDDLYKTRQQRTTMAQNVHPLFITRGVPGTHDTELGLKLIQQLSYATATSITRIPVFDKAIDDRLPQHQWVLHQGRCDVILFEGWCVGCTPQPKTALATAINELEQHEDPDAIWRTHVNQQLDKYYQELFSHLDYLMMLQVPSFEKIYEWRSLQEQKLREKTTSSHATKLMTPDEVKRFVQHYERLTRFMLQHLPTKANALLTIDAQHQISQVEFKTRE